MADTFTNNLRLILQTDLANVNQWGSLHNRSVTDLIEQALAGVFLADVTAQNVQLATANGLSDTARPMFIKATGNPGAAGRQVVVPSLDKLYIFRNETSPGFDVEFKTTLNPGVVVPSGSQVFCWVDSTSDVVRAIGASGTTVSPGGVYQTVTAAVVNATAGDTTIDVNYFVQGNVIHMSMPEFNVTVNDTVFELDFSGAGGVPAALIPGEATSPDRIQKAHIIESGGVIQGYLSVPPADANWEFLKADGTAWTATSVREIVRPLNSIWQSITD
jgi:hypothetical protein